MSTKRKIVQVLVHYLEGAEPWSFDIDSRNVNEFVRSWEEQGYRTSKSKASFKPDPYRRRKPSRWERFKAWVVCTLADLVQRIPPALRF